MKKLLLLIAALSALTSCGNNDADFWTAVATGDTRELGRAIASDADVNALNADGNGALHLSVKNPEVIRYLLTYGANPDLTNAVGITALQLAVLLGESESVSALVSAGAAVNLLDGEGESPLHLAAYHGYQSIMTNLIEAGAEIGATDFDGDSPLHEAAMGKNLDAVLYLVASGAEVNAQNNIGATAFDFGNEEIEEALENFGGKSGHSILREQILGR